MTIGPGRNLLHYRIVEKLGEGGMGQVWRAEDTKLGRQVAIKLLPEDVTADAERLARLDREAKVLASLNHPNIAAIYDLDHDETSHFLVMELVEGEDLAQRMERGAIPVEEAVRHSIQIAEALESAHESQVVHRDLKPANVKLAPDGRIKVLDFGLAKVWAFGRSDGAVSHSPTITANMTQAGVILGTAAYMSPEQARGQEVDKRSDIWSFGVLLYEMLTGDRLFAGDTATDILGAIVHCRPDWDRLPKDTPAAVVRLLKRCLTQELQERLRDIGEARYALTHLDEQLEQPDAGEIPKVRSAWPWKLAAALFLVVSVASTAGLLLLPKEGTQVLRATIEPPPDNRLLSTEGEAGPVRISPNGRLLAFVAQDKESERRVWVRSLDSMEARAVPGTEDGHRPFWSPDSRSLGFFANGKLRRVSLAGGAALAVADAPEARGGSWSPEGVIVFAPTPGGSEILRVNAGGGETRPVTDPAKMNTPTRSHREPRFLPDGRHFLFLANSSSGAGWGVYVGDIEGGEPEYLTTTAGGAVYSQGYLLVLREATLVAQRFDPKSRVLSGDPLPVAENVVQDPNYGIGVFSASPGGALVYQSGSNARTEITWFDGDGLRLGTVGPPDAYQDIALSPDGGRAAVIISENDGINDIWVVDLERATRTRLTFTTRDAPALHSDPIWSPDGRQIVFSSNRAGGYDLYSKPADGVGDAELLLDESTDLWSYSWSPDGKYVVYGHERAEHNNAEDLFVLPMSGTGEPIRLLDTPFNEWPAEFSPDGRWLAYDSPESGQREIYVVPFPGLDGRWQVSTEGGRFPRWSPDGRQLYYWRGGMLKSARVETSGGTFKIGAVDDVLSAPWGASALPYDVSPDGQRFLTLAAGEAPGPTTLSLFVNWKRELEQR